MVFSMAVMRAGRKVLLTGVLLWFCRPWPKKRCCCWISLEVVMLTYPRAYLSNVLSTPSIFFSCMPPTPVLNLRKQYCGGKVAIFSLPENKWIPAVVTGAVLPHLAFLRLVIANTMKPAGGNASSSNNRSGGPTRSRTYRELSAKHSTM